jgi:GNAT superfamily N-acetyltransferase
MHEIFNRRNWPLLWDNAMRVSKRARTEETVPEKEWYQDLLDEEGEYSDPNTLLFFEGEYIYFVDTSENTVTACDIEGDRVGELNLATRTGENVWLDNVHVDADFQHQGIGTQLVRLAVLHLEDFFVAGVQESDDYEFSLSDGGANLINRCLRNGFITKDRILFPPQVPLSKEAEVDPGLIVGFGEIGDIYTERTREEDENNLDDYERMSP